MLLFCKRPFGVVDKITNGACESGRGWIQVDSPRSLIVQLLFSFSNRERTLRT